MKFIMSDITDISKDKTMEDLKDKNIKIVYCFPRYCGGFQPLLYNSITDLVKDSNGSIGYDTTVGEILSLSGRHIFIELYEKRE